MKNLLYIGNKLQKHGFNKTSIETLGLFLNQEGFKVKYTSDQKNQFFRLIDMMITTFLYGKRSDYILIDTYSTSSFWYAFFCSQIARILNVKFIPILRGGDLPYRLKNNPLLCKMIFKYAYVNVAPSHYLLSKFADYDFTNVTYIPNSIALEKYAFKVDLKVNPSILWVRAFAEIYNPKMAIHVFKIIKDKYPNAVLTMVGPDKDGSMIATKQLAKELNLEVTFTGKLSKEEWIFLAKDYSIFINTTHFDNTPISVIEAMALGLAVVSTDVGGIPYLLSDKKNALLVSDNDVIQMAACVDALLLNNVLYSEIVNNASLLVQKMDWEVVKQDWNKLLQ